VRAGDRGVVVTVTLRRLLTVAATSVAVLTAGTGCAYIGGDDQVVRVYSARHYDLEQAFEQFNEETGIEVEFLFGTDAELRARIEQEGEDTLADVYMTVDAGNLVLAAEEGVFQPLDSSTLSDAVPEALRDPENRWFGLAKRARTIVYDPTAVEPSELSTYEALADPKWDGRLCLRGATETYTQSLVASLIARHGYADAKQIVQGWVDDAQIYSNDIDLMENIASGDCAVGIANHYYLAQLLDEDPDFGVELFWANQETGGTHVNLSGAGVTAEADDPDLAKQLLEWLATDGQEAFTSGNFEYPVNPDVEPGPLVQEFGDFTADSLHAADLGTFNAEAIRLMAETGYE
jgi:iron(III) transport system substrate-binding protein